MPPLATIVDPRPSDGEALRLAIAEELWRSGPPALAAGLVVGVLAWRRRLPRRAAGLLAGGLCLLLAARFGASVWDTATGQAAWDSALLRDPSLVAAGRRFFASQVAETLTEAAGLALLVAAAWAGRDAGPPPADR